MNTSIVYLRVDDLAVEPEHEALFAPSDLDYQVVRDGIEAAGCILQPLLVGPRRDDGRYPLLAGHQRRRAAIELGFGLVPCVIVEAANEQIVAKYDNVFRRQLDAQAAQDYRAKAYLELDAARQPTRSLAHELADLRDRFLAALAEHPAADRAQVLEVMMRELVATHPDLTETILQQAAADARLDAEAPRSEAAQSELETLRAEIDRLRRTLDDATRSVEEKHTELEEAQRVIRELKQTRVKANPDIKKIQQEIQEKHEQAINFSKQLKQAKSELEAVQETLAEKTARLEKLENQVTILKNSEAFWKQHWNYACKLVLNEDIVARDLLQASELLLHVHEVLALDPKWPARMHEVVHKGIGSIEERLARIKAQAEAATVREPDAEGDAPAVPQSVSPERERKPRQRMTSVSEATA